MPTAGGESEGEARVRGSQLLEERVRARRE